MAKTNKEWTKSLKKGVVTPDMMSEALYSYNKRAKNMRDQQRAYTHRGWHDEYDYAGKYREKKEYYYDCKEQLLSFIQPQAIHIVGRRYHIEYYLFYDMGNHSFHTPIDEKQVGKYELPIIQLDGLETYGAEIDDLMSVQTCDKIRKGLLNKTLRYEAKDNTIKAAA